MAHPPKDLQGILWSVDVNRLDLKKDKYYIVHQLLIYGTLEEIRWLFRTYGFADVVRVFCAEPARWYQKKVFYFVKNYLLGLKNVQMEEDNYVTSLYGPLRQRAAERV